MPTRERLTPRFPPAGQFAGFFIDLVQAAYSFLGMESIAIAAGEVQNPRVSVAKAVKRGE
jgi:amino acid transporter